MIRYLIPIATCFFCFGVLKAGWGTVAEVRQERRSLQSTVRQSSEVSLASLQAEGDQLARMTGNISKGNHAPVPLITSLSEASGTRLMKIHPAEPDTTAGIVTTGFGIEVEGDYAGLVDLVNGIERAAEVFGVREVVITAPDGNTVVGVLQVEHARVILAEVPL